jgi:hypothetical protein
VNIVSQSTANQTLFNLGLTNDSFFFQPTKKLMVMMLYGSITEGTLKVIGGQILEKNAL